MTESFTITVSWLELAFLGSVFFAAGAYVCWSLATYKLPPEDPTKDEPFEP